MWEFLSGINFLAVAVSALVYWALGMVWFSFIFGKVWSRLIVEQGVKMEAPSSNVMTRNCIVTYLLNFVIAFVLAIFIHALQVVTLGSALTLATIVSALAVAPMLISVLWEGRNPKLVLIDIGYPIVGIFIASIILTLWI